MTIDVKFFIVTGPVSGLNDGLIPLTYTPTTGPNESYDIAIDPIGGPTQVQGVDFGITGIVGETGKYLSYNLENSDIKSIREEYILTGETGPVLRVIYNY